MAYPISLRMAFDVFDVDGSGSLSAEEVVSILTRPGTKSMSEKEATDFITSFDENEDGGMDIEEFVVAMRTVAGDDDVEQVADGLAQNALEMSSIDEAAEGLFESIGEVVAQQHTLNNADGSAAYIEDACEAFRGAVHQAGPDETEFVRAFTTAQDGKHTGLLEAAKIFHMALGAVTTPAMEEGGHAAAIAVVDKMVDAFKSSVNEAGGFDSVDVFNAKWAAARC